MFTHFVLQWAKVEGDVVTVGISDHAQEALGDVVYVELPEVGSTVTAKATFGVVESVKVSREKAWGFFFIRVPFSVKHKSSVYFTLTTW